MKLAAIALLLSPVLFAQQLRLADVRKIYIEKMPNGLDNYLRSAISKKFHSRITLVLDQSEADAILSGVDVGTQQTQSATVNLTDPKAKVILWSGTAGDRDKKKLAIKHGGPETVADNLAGQLKKAMEH